MKNLKQFLMVIMILSSTCGAIHPVSIFNSDYGLVDLKNGDPEISIRLAQKEFFFRDFRAGFLFEVPGDSAEKVDVVVYRNNSVVYSETVRFEPAEDIFLVDTFVLEKFSFELNFPHGYLDSSPEYPNFKVRVTDTKGNILFQGYTYEIENYSIVSIQEKVVNKELLEVEVTCVWDQNRSEIIQKQQFRASSAEKRNININAGLIPFCEFNLTDSAGRGLLDTYPLFWLSLSDKFHDYKKYLTVTSDFSTIRFVNLPFLNTSKVRFELMKKNSSEADPVLVQRKDIFLSKRLGTRKIDSYMKKKIFKRLNLDNFNTFKSSFISGRDFYLEIEYGKSLKVVPFYELASEIILLDYRSDGPVHLNVIRKSGSKRELLYRMENYVPSRFLIPFIPVEMPTVIEFSGLRANSDAEFFKFSLSNSGKTFARQEAIPVGTGSGCYTIPGGTFFAGEKLTLSIAGTGQSLPDISIDTGKKNTVHVPLKKSVRMIIAPYMETGEVIVSGRTLKVEKSACEVPADIIGKDNEISVRWHDSVIERKVGDKVIFVNFQTIDRIVPVIQWENGIMAVSMKVPELPDGGKLEIEFHVQDSSNRLSLENGWSTDKLFIEVPGSSGEFSERLKFANDDYSGYLGITIRIDGSTVTKISKKLQEITGN